MARRSALLIVAVIIAALGTAMIVGAAALAQGPVEGPPDRSQDMAWVSAQQAALASRAAEPG